MIGGYIGGYVTPYFCEIFLFLHHEKNNKNQQIKFIRLWMQTHKTPPQLILMY